MEWMVEACGRRNQDSVPTPESECSVLIKLAPRCDITRYIQTEISRNDGAEERYALHQTLGLVSPSST